MKLIFISGPSGSGKTTLSKQIIGKIKNGFILSTDNYYKVGIISTFLSKFVKTISIEVLVLITNYLKKILILLLRMEFQSITFLQFEKKNKQFSKRNK